MVVNSISFLLFFVIVFTVYYLPSVRKSVRLQNLWLLAASYFFYGYTDLKMLAILIVATIAFYLTGKWLRGAIDKGDRKSASRITTLGVCMGAGILLYFKYFNFFADSIRDLLNAIGFHVSWSTLNIIVPIGVSFFTFKFISYIIEIRREKVMPSKSFLDFAVYIAFFPTLLSGPIDRPDTFLPQLARSRSFDYGLAMDGFRQVLWGIFIKMCIADNLTQLVDFVWDDLSSQSASALILAALFYTVQIYTDFDGYSHMAIGVSKILNIRVTRNFHHPFLARTTAEVWRRWHMSLMSWFRDYVYIPLGGSRCARPKVIRNTFVVFALSGLWHGADWSFVFWGLYHGCLVVAYLLLGIKAKRELTFEGQRLPTASQFAQMVLTFCLMTLGWIFFRAPSMADGWSYVVSILSLHNGLRLGHMGMMIVSHLFLLALVLLLLLVEWCQRDKEHPLQLKPAFLDGRKWLPYVLDFIVIAAIIYYGNYESSQFIYFQF